MTFTYRPTTSTCICEECAKNARGGCSCNTDLSAASPRPVVSGLDTPHGGVGLSFNGLLTNPTTGATENFNFGMGHDWLPSDWAYYTNLANNDLAFIWSPSRTLVRVKGPYRWNPRQPPVLAAGR